MATTTTTKAAGSTKATKGATYQGQAAVFVQLAKANGWAVQGGAKATALLPLTAHNWGTKQGGTPAGALLATKGQAVCLVAVFTGRNGHQGRLSMALAGTKGGRLHNLGSVRNCQAVLTGAMAVPGTPA